MDGSSTSLKSPNSENQVKKRKVEEKIVVRVKNDGKRKGDEKQKKTVPPPDSWAWRKYGQKPIRGSPFKRGYYKCSTANDCSARKQVERCNEDDSMLIITYTSTHNHPSPHTQIPKKHQSPKKKPKAESQPQVQAKAESKSQAQCEPTIPEQSSYIKFPNYRSIETQKIDKHEKLEEPYVVKLDNITPNDSSSAFCHLKNLPAARAKDEHCDFFDELHDLELQASSSFTSFIRSSSSNVLDERILVHPS